MARVELEVVAEFNDQGKKISNKTDGKQFLLDELITNIVSRLPSKIVARCRLVSKGWKDLTLDRDFIDLVFRNSTPTILVTNPRRYSRLELFAIDNWWEPAGTKLMIHRFASCSGKLPNTSRVMFSHAGLIVLVEDPYPSSEANLIILNPARPSRECVRITLSKQLRGSKIYGVYFHPILKEYCSLWEIYSDDLSSHPRGPKQISYKILSLGYNPFLRTISNAFSNRLKKRGSKPLFINNHLYWLVKSLQKYVYSGRNDIMEFNIITEEFTVIPCPVPFNTKCMYYQTHLLNIDNVLSFVLTFPSKIIIWRLEDHVERLWIAVEYTLSIDITFNIQSLFKMIVTDGKLAILLNGRLVVFNLMEGTVNDYHKWKYNDNVMFLSHQMSLASLNNCRSEITLDLDDKVVVT